VGERKMICKNCAKKIYKKGIISFIFFAINILIWAASKYPQTISLNMNKTISMESNWCECINPEQKKEAI
jgi:hypothetical protein